MPRGLATSSSRFAKARTRARWIPDPSQMTSRPIRFYLNDELTTLDAVPPTRTVLEWLREEQRLNRQAAY